MRRAMSLPILLRLILPALLLPAARAWATAPVIGQIPSPVIGNRLTTGSFSFPRYVFTDAFDLSTLAYDDNTASENLTWSYEIPGTPKYAINGDKTIDSAIDNPINPPASAIINRTMNTLPGADEINPDGHFFTATLRNIALYPYGGNPSTDQSPEAQDWNRNMQPVTFWCSDGDFATSSTVMFYTDNTYTYNQPSGWNRLSGA